MVNPQIVNVVIILGTMQLSKKVPFEDPNVLNGVRAMYIISNILIAAVYLYLQMKINGKKGKPVPSPDSPSQIPFQRIRD